MYTPKLHNNLLSMSHRPSHGASAQEAADPSPGPHLSPDARDISSRKTPRGPASPDALLRTSDACGNLPQKKTRTPVPARQERSRRGRPYPQNRDGSGKAGQAEGSLPRLAPEGRGFEQEIILLRSMINRLLSRRPLNHTYISRYMRLLIQAITADSRIPRELTDEEEVDSLIKKHFHKDVDDGGLSYYNLLPVRTAKPGDKWWPWRQLVSIDERRRDGLIDEDDSTMLDALDKAEARYYGNPFDDDLSDDTGIFDEDLDDEYEQWPDPDDDDDPDDDPNPGGGAARAEALEACPELGRRVRARGGPRPTNPSPYNEDSPLEIPVIPDSDRESIPRGGAVRPSPSPVGVPLVGTLDAAHADTLDAAHPDTGPSPKPRIARGRPPP